MTLWEKMAICLSAGLILLMVYSVCSAEQIILKFGVNGSGCNHIEIMSASSRTITTTSLQELRTDVQEGDSRLMVQIKSFINQIGDPRNATPAEMRTAVNGMEFTR